MLHIITDSACDLTRQEAEELGIQMVNIHIQFPDGPYPQETATDLESFYTRLQQAEKLPATSQPSPEEYLQLFQKAQESGDEVLVLTLSGGLSGTVNAARLAKELCGYERVYILDSRLAIAAQRICVEQAAALRDQSLSAAEILLQLEPLCRRTTAYGILDTLTYLRKGGRIPAGLAVLGNTLKLKPVIVLEDGVLKTIGKGLGRAAGKKLVWQRLERFPPDPAFPLYFVYTSDPVLGRQFMEETVERFALQNFRRELVPIGGVIGTHIGTNCAGLSYVMQK